MGTKYSADRLVKHVFQALLSQGRTLEISDGVDVLGHLKALGVSDGGLLFGFKLFHRVLVFTQIEFGSDQDIGDIGGVMGDFGVPLGRS